jgi:hypothetical protein
MRHNYVLATVRQRPDGWTPAFRKGTGFLLLSSTVSAANTAGSTTAVGLYDVTKLPRLSRHVRAAPPDLVLLLDAARGYPPALASGCWHMTRQPQFSFDEFAAEMARVLTERLSQQRDSRHCLIRSLAGDMDRDVGGYVWVVNYRPQNVGREVHWVAWDYQAYDDAVSTFDVDPAWLAARFAGRG